MDSTDVSVNTIFLQSSMIYVNQTLLVTITSARIYSNAAHVDFIIKDRLGFSVYLKL